MTENPQTPESPNVYTKWVENLTKRFVVIMLMKYSHPVDDSFVMLCKASLLVSRAARLLRDWYQRDIQPGDDLDGAQKPEFQKLVNDCYALQLVLALAPVGSALTYCLEERCQRLSKTSFELRTTVAADSLAWMFMSS